MEVILLESFDKLGGIGDVVVVKDGFARNFLIPQKKALRANKENKEYFVKIKNELLAKNKKIIEDANEIIKEISNEELIFIRNASDNGQLYGSVTPRDISNYFVEKKLDIKSSNINLHKAIKKIGIYDINIKLHSEVSCNLKLNVATSKENAKIQRDEEENKKNKLKDTKNSSEKFGKIDQEVKSDSKEIEEDKESVEEEKKETKDKKEKRKPSDKIIKTDQENDLNSKESKKKDNKVSEKKLEKEKSSTKDIKAKNKKEPNSKKTNLDSKPKQSKK
tara:strand:+ start:264 stop:1094 length:831 start_codon:yes stop_codon:yes gene_type:complete